MTLLQEFFDFLSGNKKEVGKWETSELGQKKMQESREQKEKMEAFRQREKKLQEEEDGKAFD